MRNEECSNEYCIYDYLKDKDNNYIGKKRKKL